MSLLREIALTPEGPLPADKIPSALNIKTPRKGGPIAWEWRVEFVDENGDVIAGGSCEVQWYSVEPLDPELNTALKTGPYAYRPQPVVRTQELGDVVAADAGTEYTGAIFNGGWPWPRITEITEPEVDPLSYLISVLGAEDGDYSIQVNDEDPLVHTASGETAGDIRDALLLLLLDHEIVEATASGAAGLLVAAKEPGVNFSLTVSAPSNFLRLELVTPLLPVPVALRLYMIVTGSAPLPPAA